MFKHRVLKRTSKTPKGQLLTTVSSKSISTKGVDSLIQQFAHHEICRGYCDWFLNELLPQHPESRNQLISAELQKVSCPQSTPIKISEQIVHIKKLYDDIDQLTIKGTQDEQVVKKHIDQIQSRVHYLSNLLQRRCKQTGKSDKCEQSLQALRCNVIKQIQHSSKFPRNIRKCNIVLNIEQELCVAKNQTLKAERRASLPSILQQSPFKKRKLKTLVSNSKRLQTNRSEEKNECSNEIGPLGEQPSTRLNFRKLSLASSGQKTKANFSPLKLSKGKRKVSIHISTQPSQRCKSLAFSNNCSSNRSNEDIFQSPPKCSQSLKLKNPKIQQLKTTLSKVDTKSSQKAKALNFRTKKYSLSSHFNKILSNKTIEVPPFQVEPNQRINSEQANYQEKEFELSTLECTDESFSGATVSDHQQSAFRKPEKIDQLEDLSQKIEEENAKKIKSKNKKGEIEDLIDQINQSLPNQQIQAPSQQLIDPIPQIPLSVGGFHNQNMTIDGARSTCQVKQSLKHHEKTESNGTKQKKLTLNPTKLCHSGVEPYLLKNGIKNQGLINQIQSHQHYIYEFHLEQQTIAVAISAVDLCKKAVIIKLWKEFYTHDQNAEVLKYFLLKSFQRFMDTLHLVSLCERVLYPLQTLPTTIEKTSLFQYSEYQRCFVSKAIPKQSKTTSEQFLELSCVTIAFKQKIPESFFFSDQICEFKSGKYDAAPQFTTIQTQAKYQSFQQLNETLEKSDFDTFEINQETLQTVKQCLFDQKQFRISLQLAKENFLFCGDFRTSNGWIGLKSSNIFSSQKLKICKVTLSDGLDMYLGKGFEHIAVMKNKITHYQTKKSIKVPNLLNKQSLELHNKIINVDKQTWIRMFSKQIYGLISYDSDSKEAFYGNWQMNFKFKNEIYGKVLYDMNSQSNNQQAISFGHQSFFVTLYKNESFYLGWEVNDDDFIF